MRKDDLAHQPMRVSSLPTRLRFSIATGVAVSLFRLATRDAGAVVDASHSALLIRIVTRGPALLDVGGDRDHGGPVCHLTIVAMSIIVGLEETAADAQDSSEHSEPCSAQEAGHGFLRMK